MSVDRNLRCCSSSLAISSILVQAGRRDCGGIEKKCTFVCAQEAQMCCASRASSCAYEQRVVREVVRGECCVA